jgi:tetratricopeptide (TPR) repeat protein
LFIAGSIGFASAQLGRRDEARAWLSKALAADPNHVATLGNSGALYVAQGDLARARSDLDRIKWVLWQSGRGAWARSFLCTTISLAARTTTTIQREALLNPLRQNLREPVRFVDHDVRMSAKGRKRTSR